MLFSNGSLNDNQNIRFCQTQALPPTLRNRQNSRELSAGIASQKFFPTLFFTGGVQLVFI
jgi:hypothetical protein